MNGLALCAGIGGLELALKLVHGDAYRCVCYVERQGYAAATLVARMEGQALDKAPIWDDVTTFDGTAWRGQVDIVSAGYPCQPFSVAGNRLGCMSPDDRWPDVARVVRESKPSYVFLENVPGTLDTQLPQVKHDLEAEGYFVRSSIVSPTIFGARHERQRVFTLAAKRPYPHLQRPQEAAYTLLAGDRGDNELAPQLDINERLRAIGNAVVPVVGAYALITLAQAINHRLAAGGGVNG